LNCKKLLGGSVKSSVIIGHVGDGEKVAIAFEFGGDNGEEKRNVFDRLLPYCKLVDEFEKKVFSADDIKFAIGLAACGS
jgi:hypothetical protein